MQFQLALNKTFFDKILVIFPGPPTIPCQPPALLLGTKE